MAYAAKRLPASPTWLSWVQGNETATLIEHQTVLSVFVMYMRCVYRYGRTVLRLTPVVVSRAASGGTESEDVERLGGDAEWATNRILLKTRMSEILNTETRHIHIQIWGPREGWKDSEDGWIAIVKKLVDLCAVAGIKGPLRHCNCPDR